MKDTDERDPVGQRLTEHYVESRAIRLDLIQGTGTYPGSG